MAEPMTPGPLIPGGGVASLSMRPNEFAALRVVAGSPGRRLLVGLKHSMRRSRLCCSRTLKCLEMA